MVFESIVVDILNKFLGDYVQNLDSSQLKIGIWGGDVALKNLSLKPSALDELNLPVKTVYGHLGNLTLKIPWKNIYTAPVEVSVENLFLLVNPIQDIVYDKEKEEKWKQEIKQAAINKVELAKKAAREKDNAKVDDTFVEKLAAQIIKNVQVFIKNIHMRYEDRITKPEHPFSIGISLHTLQLHSTNESCDRYVLPQQESPIFYKKMTMEGLSVYWNIDTKLFTDHELKGQEILDYFLEGISKKSQTVADYMYMLGPINSDAKLQINSKPELMSFITPKMYLSLVLEELSINLSRAQYQDCIALAEAFDRMVKSTPYRKYRPNKKTYRGYYKCWWKFAITSVLEEDVKRKFRNWDWNMIQHHMKLCKEYQKAYRNKLTQKPSPQIINQLAELENYLDAFNIILLRQKVENEVEREGRLIAEQKSNRKGWFSGWFSSNKEADTQENEQEDLAKQFEKAMTDDEKQKLYRAIDYHESSSPELYPVSFVATRMEFILLAVKIIIRDDNKRIQVADPSSILTVLCAEFKDVFVAVQQRPTARSFSVTVQMQSFQTLGLNQNNVVPKLVKSKLPAVSEEKGAFLNVLYETNPEDENYDQRLHINLRPLKVVYDAQTVMRILDVFTPEKDIASVKDQIRLTANSTLEEVKEKSAMRLQYAIEKSIKLDLKIDLMAPYLIIPCGGFYTKNELSLVVNLGRISVKSKMRGEGSYNIKKLLAEGQSKDEVLNQVLSQCYDNFSVCLSDVQVLALRGGEKWTPAVDDLHQTIDGHILEPTCFYVDIFKCVIDDDPRLPKMKVDGNLPDITIRITEKRLMEVLSLLVSLPLPKKAEAVEEIEPVTKEDTSSIYDSALSLRQKLKSINSTLRKYRRPTDVKNDDELDVADAAVTDFNNVEANFTWKKLTVYIQHDNTTMALIEASVSNLEFKLTQRTYSCEVSAKLGNITLTQSYENSIVPAISTPVAENLHDHYLFSCKLLMAEKDSPVFESSYNSTAISIEADFTKLYVVAHLEAILNTIKWATNIQNHITQLQSSREGEKSPEVPRKLPRSRRSSASSSASAFDTRRKKLKTKATLTSILEDQLSHSSDGAAVKAKKEAEECIELQLIARLSAIQVCLQTSSRALASLDIDGFRTSTTLKKSSTEVELILCSISVGDLNPETMYNKIAYITEGNDAIKIKMKLNNEEKVHENLDDFDMLVKVEMSSLQCVFINEFLMDVLEFMNNFQTSKQMLVDASAAAVASATQNVQQMYQSSTKILLDIFTQAPVIILPLNNRSDEIFIIDFGDLSVKNSLKKLLPDAAGHIPLIDEIFVNLNDMKIVRTNYERTMCEFVILKPVNYTLTVKRNLSASWFTQEPGLDINGSFNTIYITIRDIDYKLLMRALNENIAARTQDKPVCSAVITTDTALKAINDDPDQIVKSEVIIEYSDESASKISTAMRFTMAVESVEVDLLSSASRNCQDSGLAKFTMSFLCVKGSMLTNNDMSVHALLSDCCVDDTRLSKVNNKVTRYMKRKTAEERAAANSSLYATQDDISIPDSSLSFTEDVHERCMIDVKYKKTNGKTYVNARVFSFILILNMDHITKIQEFFSPDVETTKRSPTLEHSKRSNTTIRGVKDEAVDITASVTNCNVVIEKPDIILVENLDDINTNAVMLNNEANLQIQISDDGRMGISGVLQNLQLYTCCYNPIKRKQTTSLILYPVTVDLNGSKSDGTNLRLDTRVSKIKITITAGTIELLARIFSSLVPNEESESDKNEINCKDYSNIWEQNTIRDDYWFLRTEEGIDIAAVDLTRYTVQNISKREDVIIVSAPFISIMLEAGVGKKTIPLLALQTSIQGTATMSANSVVFDSSVSLEIAYYNSRLGLWEPVIEPVIRSSPLSPLQPIYEPWQMQFLMQKFNNTENLSDEMECYQANETSVTSAGQDQSLLECLVTHPDLSLLMKSEERMEITVTKTGLEAIKTISQSFNEAVGLKTCSNVSTLNDPNYSFYSLTNDLGVDVVLQVRSDDLFKVVKGDVNEIEEKSSTESIVVKTGASVSLVMKKSIADDKNAENCKTCLMTILNSVSDKDNHFLRVNVPDKNKDLLLPVSRADKRFFSLRMTRPAKSSDIGSELWGLVSEVEILDGGFVTTLRSVVRVYNHLAVHIQVFYIKQSKGKSELIDAGQVDPCQHLNVPVQAVYTSNSQLYFAPSNYSVSSQPFVWKNLQQNISMSSQVQCISKNPEDKDPFFIRIIGEIEQIYHENTSSYTMASTVYNIHLRPTFIFKNFLPMDIKCQLQGVATEHLVHPGTRILVPTVEPDHSTIIIKLENYLGLNWCCKKLIRSDAPVFNVWVFSAQCNNQIVNLNLGVWFSSHEDSMIFALYCPFWMINKTGMNLFYKGADDDALIIEHPKDYDKPILFSFKEKTFFGKKKACVRVGDGEWSEKLSVDAAGSSGSAVCKTKDDVYQLGVYVKLNSNTLTKQVIFSPFFTIANNCPYTIEYHEDKIKNGEWHQVQPEKCIPFWPKVQDDKNRSLELRISGTPCITTSFSYLNFRTYPLTLMNKYGGLVADVQVTEGGVYIGVSVFHPKVAPALIINDTESSVQLAEVDLLVKNLENVRENENAALQCLQNNTTIQFWQLDAKKEFLFNWSCNHMKAPVLLINRSPTPIDLRTDGIGECTGDDTSTKKYWISFLNGMQRTVLITTNKDILTGIEAVGDFEHIQKEINFLLEGFGLSLVNDVTRSELLYFSIFSSGIIWETQKKAGKRYKPVSDVLNEQLEKAYLLYCNKLRISNEEVNPLIEIDVGRESRVVVNFAEGVVLKPQTGNLRRTYNSGLWVQVRSSERYQQIHAKVHRLQVDNQMYDCVFPVVFFPIPPPKSVAANDALTRGQVKPFAELSIVQRVNEGSNIRQYKYFKVLIQEFHVKVDIGFITSLVKFFEADNISHEEEMAQFKADESIIGQSLCHHVASVTSQDFYDLLHFSPLKIHFSFSLAGESPNSGTPQEGLAILNLLTQSIGVTLTDFNDIVFRLAYFERKHKFYSQVQLNSEVQAHYTGQLVKQLYVLVLGLDVLGNPFGLVTGLKQGVEDFFYEPFQGAIQGPSEFAEGVLLGVRSLFGHTVGGAAGAVGRITGVMGKGIAALTLDEEYQRKRRQRLAQQQQSIKDGGRELVMGVVEGVGGVISKPISGAREEGVEGFVKGVGKGVIGLFMRPASGVVDFASGTVDVVRRVATCSEEIRRYRLPRFIRENGQVVPYFRKEAQGYKYLLDIEKGRFTKTDLYLFHVLMGSTSNPDKEILLVTDNRILYLMKGGDIFADNIKVEWQYTWNEVRAEDGVGETEDGICIRIDTSESRRGTSSGLGMIGSIFKKSDKGKIVKIPDEQIRQWLLKRIKELIQKTHKR